MFVRIGTVQQKGDLAAVSKNIVCGHCIASSVTGLQRHVERRVGIKTRVPHAKETLRATTAAAAAASRLQFADTDTLRMLMHPD